MEKSQQFFFETTFVNYFFLLCLSVYLCVPKQKKMNKFIYLSTCDTCKRIMKEANISNENFELQDIKKTIISSTDLDKAFEVTKSYEALFNKRARKYAQQGLKDKNLSDLDFRALILEEYTFLKRPVAFVGQDVFIGNSKKEVAKLIEVLENEK